MGRRLILPAKNIRPDDNDPPFQVVRWGKPDAIRRRKRGNRYPLFLCRRQFLLDLFHLFYDSSPENSHGFQVAVTGKNLLVITAPITVLTKGAEILSTGCIRQIFSQDHFLVANIYRLDDFIIPSHTLFAVSQFLFSCSLKKHRLKEKPGLSFSR